MLRDAVLPLRVSATVFLVAICLPARELSVRVAGRGVVRMSVEEYAAAALGGESAGFSSPEAMRAMAICARTYALVFARRHAAEGFDFCDTTHCQDYREDGVTPAIVEALESTAGEKVWHAGTLARTYYTQDCGGMSEDAAVVWPGERAAYLARREDPYCGKTMWRSEVKKAELDRVFPNRPRTIAVTARTRSGRAAAVRLDGVLHPAPVFRFMTGRALGWNFIRSEWFEVADGGAVWVFSGRGGGHGVGLCQAGAEAMGKGGKTAREILAFYYPGTVVGLTAAGVRWRRQSGERVEVLAADSGARLILEQAERAAAEAERAAGRPFGRRVRVRVYPSVAAFRDATGEPGWVAASTRGHVVRLQPRAANASVLRHEMAHALVESEARAPLPLWFREGLAMRLAGERRGGAAPGTPPDEAFAGARSRAELDRLHAASAAAVGELVSRFGLKAVVSWLERGIPREAVPSARPGKSNR